MLQMGLTKLLPVEPSISLLGPSLNDMRQIGEPDGNYPKFAEYNVIELNGVYTASYNANFGQLCIIGRREAVQPMTVEGLIDAEIWFKRAYMPEDQKIKTYNYNSISSVRLLPPVFPQLNNQIADIYSVVVLGPISITSDKHKGILSLSYKAAYSPTTKTAKIAMHDFFPDFNKDNPQVAVKMQILRSDDPKWSVAIMPLNNFEVVRKNVTEGSEKPETLKGQFFGSRQFHYIYTRPWDNTAVVAKSNMSYSTIIGVPSRITIKVDTLDYVSLKGFEGWYRIDSNKEVIEKGSQDWKIRTTKISEISVNTESHGSSQVLVQFLFKGEVSELTLNDDKIRKFLSRLFRALAKIWLNPYIVGLVLVIYAPILLSWARHEKG